jgi:hypothetical protein
VQVDGRMIRVESAYGVGDQPLKHNYDKLLSNFAFKYNSRHFNEAGANLIRERMRLCGNPTGSRASIVWMQATVVAVQGPQPAPAADANADADTNADAVDIMTAMESEWLSLQLGGAELRSPEVRRCRLTLSNPR